MKIEVGGGGDHKEESAIRTRRAVGVMYANGERRGEEGEGCRGEIFFFFFLRTRHFCFRRSKRAEDES